MNENTDYISCLKIAQEIRYHRNIVLDKKKSFYNLICYPTKENIKWKRLFHSTRQTEKENFISHYIE